MEKIANVVTTIIKKAVKVSLSKDANSTTCSIIYQPKVPVKLNSFKKKQ